ncbi:MAG: sulfatase-like hydrolase/transferase [Halobacteriaceae archaeon]
MTDATASGGSRDADGDDPPNVLLVVLDSVRAANTSLHGYRRQTTPFLERYADRAGVAAYDHAVSPGNTSVTSHASMFTGRHVPEHGLSESVTDRRLAPGHTVWEDLPHETGVFSNNPFLTELDVGLRDAFETVVARRQELPFPDGVNVKHFLIDAGEGLGRFPAFARAAATSDRPIGSLVNGLAFRLADTRAERLLPERWRLDGSADVYVDALLDWVDERAGPWAACVNLMDAHFPYQPGEHDAWGDPDDRYHQATVHDEATIPWSYLSGERPLAELERLVDRYDGAVRHLDAAVEGLVGALADRDALAETLVVVTADHGEGFGEAAPLREGCRFVGHGNGGVGEPLVHVPLVVDPPGDGDGAVAPDGPIASLTNVPDAVAAALDGDPAAAAAAFARDPVLTTTPGTDLPGDAGVDGDDVGEGADPVVDRDDLAPYGESAGAVYRAAEGAVDAASADRNDAPVARKHERWGPVAGALDVWRDGRVTAAGEADPDALALLDDLEPADLLEATSGEPVDEVTADRLEALGYR